MMHIAILQIYCGASGQFGSYNCQEVGLAKAFAALGHRCTVAYPDTMAEAAEERCVRLCPGAQALFLPAKGLGVHAFYNLDFLCRLGVDQVLLLADNHLFAPAVHRFCRAHGIACANYIGALKSDSHSAAKRFVMDLLARRNLRCFQHSVTFAKTPAIAALLRAHGMKAQLAPVGLDLSIIPPVPGTKAQVRARLGLAQSGLLLLYVGRLDPFKRPLDMAEVLSACPADTRLVCIGKGELSAALTRRFEELGLADRVTMIAALPNEQVQPYYHAADAFLNFNDHEIFGMSILEALYAGCPVIARHAPGPDLIVQPGKTGFLVTDTAEYAPALQRLAPAMGPAARQSVLERFQWKATAQTMLAKWEEAHHG